MNKSKLILKYVLFDAAASLVVWVLFVVFKEVVKDIQFFESLRFFMPTYNYFASLFFFMSYCLFVHYLTGYYQDSHKKSRTKEVGSTFASSLIVAFSIFMLRMGNGRASLYSYCYVSLIVLFGLLFILTLCFRLYISSRVRYNYKIKKWTVNTLIVGTGVNALKIAEEFENSSGHNSFIGFVSVNQKVVVPNQKILGNMSQIASIIEKYEIKEAIIVLDNADEQQLFALINSLYKFNIDIQFSPRLFEILIGSAKINRLEMSPLVSITKPTMADWELSVKRILDIVVSLGALISLSPLLLYYTIRIKRDSEGPAFYRQERIGQYGKSFEIVKFRTMYLGSETGFPLLSSADDDRITAVGRRLRKYRIDEIPQFWNVLKGDMSLVGPRPERRYYISQIIEDAPYYCLLYKIRPGLTSWGPIKIGYTDTIEKMIERLNYDIIYMENMSLVTDFKILLYTIEIIFKGKGV